jgi:hypothetical protein
VGIPECETQALHIIHSAQSPKHYDAISPFNKIKHTVTVITQSIVLSHQSNTILLQFSPTVINYVVQTQAYTIEQS